MYPALGVALNSTAAWDTCVAEDQDQLIAYDPVAAAIFIWCTTTFSSVHLVCIVLKLSLSSPGAITCELFRLQSIYNDRKLAAVVVTDNDGAFVDAV